MRLDYGLCKRGLALLAVVLLAMACSDSNETEKDSAVPDKGVDLGPDAALPDMARPDLGPDKGRPDTGPPKVWKTLSSGTTNTLNRVWGTSNSSVYIVGAAGTLLHYNGASVSAMTSGTTADLRGIWGTSASNVYVVGGGDKKDGVVLHFDGSAWTTKHSNSAYSLYGVWGSSASDLYAAGHGSSGGVILTSSGSAWTEDKLAAISEDLVAISGVSATEVYACGQGKVHEKLSSGLWGEAANLGLMTDMLDVYSVDAKHTMAVGKDTSGNGVLVFTEDSVWKSSTLTGIALHASWGTTKGALYYVGAQKTTGIVAREVNKQFQTLKSVAGKLLHGIWGAANGELFAVGAGGTVLQYAIKK